MSGLQAFGCFERPLAALHPLEPPLANPLIPLQRPATGKHQPSSARLSSTDVTLRKPLKLAPLIEFNSALESHPSAESHRKKQTVFLRNPWSATRRDTQQPSLSLPAHNGYKMRQAATA